MTRQTDDTTPDVSLPNEFTYRLDGDTVTVIHDDGMQVWPTDAFKSALDTKAPHASRIEQA